MKQSGWDLDYATGLVGERLVDELLTGNKKVEVKRDMRWAETGNVYIEIQCWYNGTQEWKDSGLVVSQAHYWAFVLNETILIIPYEKLVQAVAKYGVRTGCNIEPNPSRGYLVKVVDLIAISK